MWLALIISTFGGTLVIHFLKNFLLGEKKRLTLDLDGLLERLLITYILIESQGLLFLIPIVILLKTIFRLSLIGFFEGLSKTTEPGGVWYKVKLKGELAFDLILSPAWAILMVVIF